jgi:hypothetical protein
MNDPVLNARIRALSDDLALVKKNLEKGAWRNEQQADTRAEMEVDSFWIGLETTLNKEIERQQTALEKIGREVYEAAEGNEVVINSAWTRYNKVLQLSRDLLRECLEIIGALAIRNKDLDKRIWYVADELIRECLILSTGEEYYYLSIHGMQDTFTKTRSRILRLRFPEWTIWDLPLAAHELGHVIIWDIIENEKDDDEDERILTEFVDTHSDALIPVDDELTRMNQEAGSKAEDAKRWAEKRVHEFLADAFATYTMGPAYACSAILLRLNPGLAAMEGTPSDAQRAHVILSMLEWANSSLPLIDPYDKVIQELRGYWNDTLSRVNPNGKLSLPCETRLSELAVDFGMKAYREILRKTALYPQTGEREGWARAQVWANQWLGNLTAEEALENPPVASENLRDVLNATWFCRLQLAKLMKSVDTDKQVRPLKDLQNIGQEQCNRIMAKKGKGVPVPVPATRL